jgi:uncharacterized protein YukE
MPTVTSPVPAYPTGGSAPFVSAPNVAPLIAAQEQALADYLNQPVQDILSRLGLLALAEAAQRNQDAARHDAPPAQATPTAPPAPSGGRQGDAMGLIKPVLDALGTLGNGNFGGGSDPTQALAGISRAFDTTSNPLQQAVSNLISGWTGDASTAASDKTASAIANGTQLNQQAAELRRSLISAVTQVMQARVRLIATITQFQSTIQAIGPNLAFPWGWAAAVAAAVQAIMSATQTMTELQSTLGTESSATTSAGTPVAVTAAPTAAAALAPQVASTAASTAAVAPQAAALTAIAPLMSPMMQLASVGVSAGTGAISSGVQAGAQAAAVDSATLAADTKPDGTGAPGSGATPAQLAHAGGGGGGASVGAVAARTLAPMSAPTAEATSAAAQPSPVRAASATAGGMGAGGGGMMGGAPMHGGKAGVSGHDAPSFLHTSDQGGEIVGDLGNVAPPVIGEADPHEMPDIELRI